MMRNKDKKESKFFIEKRKPKHVSERDEVIPVKITKKAHVQK